MSDTQDAARRLRRCRRLRGGILDCRCARRSARRQVGTKGWSFPIEQRDTAIDLKTHQHPLYMSNLLNLTHTTRFPVSAGAPSRRPLADLLAGAILPFSPCGQSANSFEVLRFLGANTTGSSR